MPVSSRRGPAAVRRGRAFDEDYLYFFGPLLDEVAERDTDLIFSLLGLKPAMRVLDLACGHGRISNRLAARGIDVAGLDRCSCSAHVPTAPEPA